MEQQSFPCYSCGQPNLIGQPFCGYCGQPLQYNCPNCGNYVNNTYSECPYCRTPLYWPAQEMPPDESQQQASGGYGNYYESPAEEYDYDEEPAPRGRMNLTAIVSIVVLVLIVATGGILYATDNLPGFLASGPGTNSANTTGDEPEIADTTTDNGSPGISSPAASQVQHNSATITWTTTEPATSQVEYGTTTGYGSTSSLDTSLTTNHSVVISSLNPNTTYFFRVRSEDEDGNLTTSSNVSFTTSAAPQAELPEISAITDNVTASAATIRWTTDKQTTSQVDYGKTSSFGSQTTKSTAMVTSHTVNITGLDANTTYYYRVRSQDSGGNEAVSSANQFKTSAEDSIAPHISAVAYSVTDNTTAEWDITITWITDEEASSEVEYGTDSSDLDQTSGEKDTSNRRFEHSVLIEIDPDDGPYYFKAISVDSAGNKGTSGTVQITIADSS